MKQILFISIIFYTVVFSNEDSTRVFRLDDVVITGTKTVIAVEKLPSSVEVIDSLEIAQSNGTTLADIVKNSSGISLRSYGGNGALQSISVRGMGSDYSLILINGVRFTTFQISTVDVGIFSLAEVERIEIAGGGNSSLYGADAVGGVINIITKRPDVKYFAAVSNSIGSYGLTRYQISAGGGDDRFSYRATMELKRASNAFDFFFDDGITKQKLQREGSDYSLKNVSLSAQTLMAENIVSYTSFRYSEADRGQPAAVTNAVQDNHARVYDADIFLSSSTEMKYCDELNISLPIAYHHNRQKYSDPTVITNGVSLLTHYENNILDASPSLRYTISTDNLLVAGSDLAIASIISNEVNPSRREQFSLFLSSQHRFLAPFEIMLFPSIRYDTYSDIKGDISSKIGINIGVLDAPKLRLRASYGKNFRIPTFNDLYWVVGGNPNILPEHSVNFDGGVIGGIRFKEIDISTEVNYFSIKAKDKIVWLPLLNAIWSPRNLQSVSSSGIELGANVNMFSNLLMVNYHHNFIKSIKTSADIPNDASQNKILPFVPQEFSNVTIGSAFKGFSLNVLYSFTGYMYETTDNNPRFILPTFETVDVNLSYGFSTQSISIRFKGEVNNITNTEYQLITNYPTPLRNYVLTTEVSF